MYSQGNIKKKMASKEQQQQKRDEYDMKSQQLEMQRKMAKILE